MQGEGLGSTMAELTAKRIETLGILPKIKGKLNKKKGGKSVIVQKQFLGRHGKKEYVHKVSGQIFNALFHEKVVKPWQD